MSKALQRLETAIRRTPSGIDVAAVQKVSEFWRENVALKTAKDTTGIDFLPISGPAKAEGNALGEWIWPLKKGDIPWSEAGAIFWRAAKHANADVIYADDVVLAEDRTPVFRAKPSPDRLLLTYSDYIGSAAIFRRSALSTSEIRDLETGADPVAILRARGDLKLAHLPFPALISEANRRSGAPAPASGAATPVSVVIPNRDSPALIRRALDGVLRETDWPHLSVTVIDNGSENGETLSIYEEWSGDSRFNVEIRKAPFNFSAMVNRGVALSGAEHVLLLNNDIEVISPDWVSRMAGVLEQPDIGVVGAKLLFPDNTIQHAGVIVGHGGVAGHDWKAAEADAIDALDRLRLPHQRSAVTAAAMLTTRRLWNDLGGFDETAFPVAFNDVDFCLRAREAGAGVAMAPEAVLIHHEGKSRKKGVSPRRWLKHQRERAALRSRHKTVGLTDPFENPWRDHDALIPRYRAPDGIPQLRF